MAYRLELTEQDVPTALREAAAEQLADAARNLREVRVADPVTAVHEARKDLKKTRSILRLAREGMTSDARRDINAALRDIAGRLSSVRDADVMVETLDKLRDGLPALQYAEVHSRFSEQALQSRAAADGAISEEVVSALMTQLAAARHWPVDDADRRDLAMGITIAYARGREELHACRDDRFHSGGRAEVEMLHEWRKRVKDLWYHAKLLEEAWPPVLQALGDEAHTLADHLGDDHDLGVLHERITAQEWPASVDTAKFLAAIDARRGELQAKAFDLGERLYAEKPKAFARRIATYLVT